MHRKFLSRSGTTCRVFAVAFGTVLVTSNLFAQTAPRAATNQAGPAPRAASGPSEPLSPQLAQILRDWAAASGRIQKLQGEHRRYVYDTVFGVEKRATGVFYYESPDRGRIDIEGEKIGRGEVSRRTDKKSGKPFTLESDQAQRWICTGTEIRQIDDVQKTVEVFKIPPENQGENIMEGPLPFLFGMPPEKAQQRYHLTLLKLTEAQAWLSVRPRWKKDAVNWREAKVILDRRQYLPMAVQLVDPSGNLETVYTFSRMVINKPQSIFRIGRARSPFSPDLPRDYKIVRKQITPAAPAASVASAQPPIRTVQAPAGRAVQKTSAVAEPRQNPVPRRNLATVPAVMNFPYKDAAEVLKKAGFEVKFIRGRPATRSGLTYVVYEQKPGPREQTEPGGVVRLTLYDKPQTASAGSGGTTGR